MIFVVVGTQEPFERLVQYIDEWSIDRNYQGIFAQISNASYKPQNFEWISFIPQAEFDEKFQSADLIISHAGMGTIISALQFSKPIIVMPRLAKFKEHRNDHQLATAQSFEKLGYVKSVYNKMDLFKALDQMENLKPITPISNNASDILLKTIHDFIFQFK